MYKGGPRKGHVKGLGPVRQWFIGKKEKKSILPGTGVEKKEGKTHNSRGKSRRNLREGPLGACNNKQMRRHYI